MALVHLPLALILTLPLTLTVIGCQTNGQFVKLRASSLSIQNNLCFYLLMYFGDNDLFSAKVFINISPSGYQVGNVMIVPKTKMLLNSLNPGQNPWLSHSFNQTCTCFVLLSGMPNRQETWHKGKTFRLQGEYKESSGLTNSQNCQTIIHFVWLIIHHAKRDAYKYDIHCSPGQCFCNSMVST